MENKTLNKDEIRKLIEEQKKFFFKGQTRDINFRIEQLKKLKDAIKSYESKIKEALKSDLNKSSIESYVSEIAFVYSEITYAIKHIRKLSKPKKVKTPLILKPGKSYIYP
ncbi:MAG: aldehyde dehydrogenase, partial [bacterium]